MSLQPEKVKSDLCAESTICKQLFEEFVSCNQLADQFTTRYHVPWRDTVMPMVHLVFDRYDVPNIPL